MFGSLDDVTSGLWDAFKTGSAGVVGGALGSLEATVGTAFGSLDHILG